VGLATNSWLTFCVQVGISKTTEENGFKLHTLHIFDNDYNIMGTGPVTLSHLFYRVMPLALLSSTENSQMGWSLESSCFCVVVVLCAWSFLDWRRRGLSKILSLQLCPCFCYSIAGLFLVIFGKSTWSSFREICVVKMLDWGKYLVPVETAFQALLTCVTLFILTSAMSTRMWQKTIKFDNQIVTLKCNNWLTPIWFRLT
jgi:hypothetical protein